MFDKITDPIYDTLLNGTIVNRVVLIAGVALILYGANEILLVYMDIWNQLVPGPSETNRLEPILTAFLSVVVGLLAVVLGTLADFSWNPEASH